MLNLPLSDELFAKQAIEQLYDPRVVAYLVKTKGDLNGLVSLDEERQLSALDPDKFQDFIMKLLEQRHATRNSHTVKRFDPFKHADALVEIATNDEYGGSTWAGGMAVERLSANQGALVKVASSGKGAADKAMEKLGPEHQSVFIKAAIDDSATIPARLWALKKLTDGNYDSELTDLLLKLESGVDKSDPKYNDGLFLMAIKKLGRVDAMLMVRIAQHHKDSYVRRAAIQRMPLNEESIPFLINLLNKHEQWDVCEEAAIKLDVNDKHGPFHNILQERNRRHELKGVPGWYP